MPGIYGLDILLTLRELNPTARVIVVTADIQESTRREAQNRGAVAILKKPVNAEILKKTVVGVLAGSDQWQ